MISATEEALLDLCRAGDQTAWRRLYKEYGPTVRRFVARMLMHDGEIDDVVQQVFVEFFSSLGRFRGDSRLTTWLYRIAAHVVGKQVRTEFRRRRRREALQLEVSVHGEVGHADVHASAEVRAQLALLGVALDDLGMKHRLVWVMRELEGFSTEEVAEVLETRVGTVRSRLFYARKKIVDAFEEAGYGTGAVAGLTSATRGPELASETRGGR
jgi:RNA polymerase sigma-70 factor (ECF subfamily)